jgi:hypothetical protein
MTKNQFLAFLKENPQYQKYLIKGLFDNIWGKYAVKKKGRAYSVVFFDDYRGGILLYETEMEDDAYDFLYRELTKSL